MAERKNNSKKKTKSKSVSSTKKKTTSVAKGKKNNDSTTKRLNNKISDERKKIEDINNKTDGDIWNKVIIISIIIIILCLFYLLTVYITNKHSSDDNSGNNSTALSEKTKSKSDDSSVDISTDKTIVGRSFSLSDSEYIIVYYDSSDEDINSKFSELISTYNGKEDHLNIYSVDMSNGLNKKYAKEESNTNPTKVSEISINGPTMIKFSNGEVIDYIEGYDEISSYLS